MEGGGGGKEEGGNFCGYLMWHNCGWFNLAVTMVMVVKETKIHLVFVKYRYRVPFKLLFLIDLC